MTDLWDDYARSHPIGEDQYRAEETQWLRVQKLLDRCVGTVLDIGSGDGWIARELVNRGHYVECVESSEIRRQRIKEMIPGVHVWAPEGIGKCQDAMFDTVLLGEVLEHLEDPGELLAHAFRIARERVVISVPLQGWCDPTHQWRISMDHFSTPETRPGRPATSEQVILTMQRGECWPLGYMGSDPKWRAQFVEGH